MMVLRALRWSVLLFGLWSVSIATTARAQTLEDALVSAYLTRPELQADHARQRALDEDVARANGGWRPQIQLSGQAGYGTDRLAYEYLSPHQTLQETLFPEGATAQIVQPIFDGGKTAADVAHAKSEVQAGLAHTESVEENVLADAVESYLDLERDQQILELSKKSVEALEDELKSVRARFEKQDATVADLSQSETRLAQGIAQRVAAEGAVAASESTFKQTTGLQPPAKLAPPRSLPVALLPATRDEAISLAMHNPTVREAEQGIDVAQADVRTAESALKPIVTFNLSSQYQSDVSQGHFKAEYNEAMANLTIPLYSGGVDYARTREAKTIVGQRELEADDTRQQAIDRATRAWDQLYTVRARIDQLKVQVDTAERAWNSIQVEVNRGYREIIDELNAEQEFVSDQVSLVQAQHDEAVATFAVLGSVGRLTARALKLPVTYYDPEKNYKAESGRWFGTGIPNGDDLRRSPP